MSEQRSRRRMAGSDEHDILQWDVGDLMPAPLEVSTLFDAGPSSALRPLPSLPPPPALDAYLSNAWLPEEEQPQASAQGQAQAQRRAQGPAQSQADRQRAARAPSPAPRRRAQQPRPRTAREAWPGAASPRAPRPPSPQQLVQRQLREQQRRVAATGGPAQGFLMTVLRGLEAVHEAAEQESTTKRRR